MSVFITDSNGKLVKVAGGTEGFSLPIGSIFSSAIPLNDASVHLLDGSLISQSGMYEEFANLINSLVSAGHQISCTQAQFESDLSTYGQCGKFVIDNSAKTIRLPFIKEFIASNNGGQIIGLAELDEFKSHTHIQNSHNHSFSGNAISGKFGIRGAASGQSWMDQDSYVSGVFSKGTKGVSTYIINGTSSKYSTGLESINLNATPSGTIGGTTATNQNTGGSETKPKNIRYPYYIVLASGYKSNELVNINNIVSDVNLKQDKLIANPVALNTTRAGQNDTVIEHYMSSDGLTWYRKWASGWKECGGFKTISSNTPVTLPVQFSNTNYNIHLTAQTRDTTILAASYEQKTTNSFIVRVDSWTGTFNYHCCGF